MATHSSISSTLHPLQKFSNAVLSPDSNFKFNHVSLFEDGINCNSWFTKKLL